MLRRAVLALCSVLAQFGGVALAFAFLATIGLNGVLTLWVRQLFGWDLAGSGWLYGLAGLILVYTYFQIPLMVIVFIPALEGLREQWREAAVNLGASTWQYLREVAVPLLMPAFLARRCCCSPTHLPPTPPRLPWSVRAARSCRC